MKDGKNMKSNELAQSVIDAYSDCTESYLAGALKRRYSFLAPEFVSRDEAYEIMRAAVPRGYNDFRADRILAFSPGASIQLAREGSVAMYVLDDPMPSRETLGADEWEPQEDGSVRVWWD
jgi:hypothetical protein